MVSEASSADEQPFLDQLPGDLVEEIRSIGVTSKHPEGSILVAPGMRMDALCFILQGAVGIANPSPPLQEIRRPGDCFAEQCFMSGDPAAFTVTARTLVRILGLTRIQVADLARRRHEFGYALSRWVTRPSRLRKQAPPPTAGLVGSLETMPIADLVQVLNICRKTGLLRLSRGRDSASLYFEDGEIRHAEAGDRTGEEAFYRLMAWTDAAFAFESGVRAASASLAQPTMTLLMEGLRRIDESRRGNAKVASE